MKHLLSIILVLLAVCPAFSQISRAEYFLDTDPGHGNASAISMPAGSDVSKAYNVGLLSAAEGFHSVGIRSQDVQGHWSHTLLQSFYVQPLVSPSITANEYFIDTDPGYGKATAVSGSTVADGSIKLLIPLSSYLTGFHTIGMRTKDGQGKWSLTTQSVFYLTQSKAPVNIIGLQYYFVSDSTQSDRYTCTLPAPAFTADLNFTADLSKLPADKIYDMHIWAVNEENAISEVLVKKVKVCSGDVARAKYNFVQDGYNVSFINNSSGAGKYQWNFGDNQTDSISNPLHIYANVGNYSVRLVVSNFCNTDTFKSVISIAGIKSITSNRGGNAGPVTVNINGAGFVTGMQLYLHKNGEPDITGDTLIIRDSSNISTTFDLNNKTLGLYDVIAVFASNKTDTLHNGFKIEEGTEPKLWANIAGPGILRIGFNQIVTITYGNSGNKDAVLVPLLITGLPLGTNIELLNPLFKPDSSFHLRQPDSLSGSVQDSLKNVSLKLLYIDKIAAGFSGTLNVIFHLPANATLRSSPDIQVILGKPLGNSIDTAARLAGGHRLMFSGNIDYNALGSCLATIGGAAASMIDVGLDLLPMHEFQRCVFGSMDIGYDLLKKFIFKQRESGMVKEVFDQTVFWHGVLETAGNCASAGLQIAFPEAKIAKMAAHAIKYFNAVMDVNNKLFQYPLFLEKGYEIADNCAGVYVSEFDIHRAKYKPLIGNASDPNEKYGTGDASTNHYTNGRPLIYTIGFENSPSANLNAQTITVLDTLNLARYDKSSFAFTSVTIGDSVFALVSPAKSFLHDFNFTSRFGVRVRVTAAFDTITGIAQWKFLSINPVTNQATTDALAGFLPPNSSSPTGQGYVSYKVNPNSNINSGDTVYNKAAIVFDYNLPVITNNWQNTFDMINPASRVSSLPVETYDTTFKVSWRGTDNASGIQGYDVYFARNNGAYRLWLHNVSKTDSLFTGQLDSTYNFYSIARDNAGNIEASKIVAETSTHIVMFTALPVTLLNFSARLNGDNILITWTTISEQNSSHFNLQRSADGINFVTINTQNAAGNASLAVNYNYVDNNITALNLQKIYYRLQMVDKDGKQKSSGIIQINIQSPSFSAAIMPNPIGNELTLYINSPTDDWCDVLIADASGKTISNDRRKISKGNSMLYYNSANWAAGIYILKLSTPGGILKTYKITK